VSYPILYDSAFPPAHPPVTDGVLIYTGGAADHVWTDEEINAQGNRLRLPVWCYGRDREGAADGEAFAAWLHAHDVPKHSAVMLDMETLVDTGYVNSFYEETYNWALALYGSVSTVFANPETDGWFPADWTGHPHLFAHEDVIGTQFAAAQLRQTVGPWDLSMMAPTAELWSPADFHPLHEIITSGLHSLAHIATAHETAASTILRETLSREKDGRFPARLAEYINGHDLDKKMPAGLRLWYRDGGN
jgi:hypothetical protein